MAGFAEPFTSSSSCIPRLWFGHATTARGGHNRSVPKHLRVLCLLALAVPAAARLPRAEGVSPRQRGVVSFLAFGDSGTGGSGQRHVAAAMSRVLAAKPVD